MRAQEKSQGWAYGVCNPSRNERVQYRAVSKSIYECISHMRHAREIRKQHILSKRWRVRTDGSRLTGEIYALMVFHIVSFLFVSFGSKPDGDGDARV